ncbi:hypothetical protein BDN70DRAFT_973865, partial [Pholiota conissans]
RSLENLHATDSQLATLPQVTNLVAFGNSSPALEILWGRAMSPYGNSPVVDFTQLRKLYIVWYNDFIVNSTKTVINNAISLEHIIYILPEGSKTFYGFINLLGMVIQQKSEFDNAAFLMRASCGNTTGARLVLDVVQWTESTHSYVNHILQVSPHLANYIRNLHFCVEFDSASANYTDSDATARVLDQIQKLHTHQEFHKLLFSTCATAKNCKKRAKARGRKSQVLFCKKSHHFASLLPEIGGKQGQANAASQLFLNHTRRPYASKYARRRAEYTTQFCIDFLQPKKCQKARNQFVYLLMPPLDIDSDEKTCGYDWRYLEPRLAAALLRLVLSPGLQSLTIANFKSFPAQSLLGLKNSVHLNRLFIQNLESEVFEYTEVSANAYLLESAMPSKLPRLLNLFSGKWTTLIMEVLVGGTLSPYNIPLLDFSRLSNFSTIWDDEQDARLSRPIIEAARNLEILHCTLQYDACTFVGDVLESIMKGPERTLRKLTLCMATEVIEDPFNTCLEKLSWLLERASSLEELHLGFSYDISSYEDSMDFVDEVVEANCIAFDRRIFGDRDEFFSLSRIVIAFTLIPDEPAEDLADELLNNVFHLHYSRFPHARSHPEVDFCVTLEALV